MFANERDIDDWVTMFSGQHPAGPEPGQMPVAERAARLLRDLKDWTNANSDGWPYWKKPVNAATKLIELLRGLDSRLYDGNFTDASQDDLKAALTPIKRMLTTHGADWREVLGGTS